MKEDFTKAYTGLIDTQNAQIRAEVRMDRSLSNEAKRLAYEDRKKKSDDIFSVLVSEAVSNPGSVTTAVIAKALKMGLDPNHVDRVQNIAKQFNPELTAIIKEVNETAAKGLFSS